MTLRDLAKTAFGNLGRHRVRTALSVVGVTVGILTIVTMVSLGIGVQREVRRVVQAAGLETVRIHPVTDEPTVFDQFTEPERTVIITPELVGELRARDDVTDVSPHINVPWGIHASLGVGDRMVRVSVAEPPWGPSEPFTLPPEFVAGEKLGSGAAGVIIVSTDSLETLGYAGQDTFDELIGRDVTLLLQAPRGDTQAFRLRLAGVFRPNYGFDGPYFDTYIGTADALALKAWWHNDPDLLAHEGYDALTVTAASLNDAVQIIEQFQKRGFRVTSLKTMLETFNKGMVILQTMLGSVGGLALFVASIGIANTMVMAIYERTREIGILKAVGAAPADIRRLFMAEAALIGLLGGLLGIIGGWLLGLGLNEAILAYLEWKEVAVTGTFFVLTAGLVLLALTFAAGVGLVAGLYPAARAARLDPLEALRYE